MADTAAARSGVCDGGIDTGRDTDRIDSQVDRNRGGSKGAVPREPAGRRYAGRPHDQLSDRARSLQGGRGYSADRGIHILVVDHRSASHDNLGDAADGAEIHILAARGRHPAPADSRTADKAHIPNLQIAEDSEHLSPRISDHIQINAAETVSQQTLFDTEDTETTEIQQ